MNITKTAFRSVVGALAFTVGWVSVPVAQSAITGQPVNIGVDRVTYEANAGYAGEFDVRCENHGYWNISNIVGITPMGIVVDVANAYCKERGSNF